MEQLRLQRVEAQRRAVEKARRVRQVNQQELAIRSAFIEVRRFECAVAACACLLGQAKSG